MTSSTIMDRIKDGLSDGPPISRDLYRAPLTWGMLLLAVASLICLTAPASANPAQRIGLALGTAGVGWLIAAATGRSVRLLALGVVSAVLGGLLLTDSARYTPIAVRFIAASVALAGLVVMVLLIKRGFSRIVAALTGLSFFGAAALLLTYDTQLLPATLGLSGLLVSLYVLRGETQILHEQSSPAPSSSTRLEGQFVGKEATAVESPPQSGPITLSQASQATLRWAVTRARDVRTMDVMAQRLLPVGDHTRAWLARFFTLMSFASVIASLGVLTDSTAVVIGAMLVAPLMQPLMGLSLSLVAGWPARAVRAGVVCAFGVMVPITFGYLLAAFAGQNVDPALNSQIVSRGSPSLLDLGIALAAGAAGAYATSREEVSDSMPGVAVAIALVPPLAVVGIAYELGDHRAALGAFVLFVTNALAIIGAGALTLILTGVVRSTDRQPIGRWVAGFALTSVFVLWALTANSASARSLIFRTNASTTVASTWCEENDYDLLEVTETDEGVKVTVGGSGTPSSAQAKNLAESLNTVLGDVTVKIVVRQQETVTVPLP